MLSHYIREAYPDQGYGFYRRVFFLSVMYAVKGIDAFKFQREVNAVFKKARVKATAKSLRLDLINHSYFCLNLKFFVLAVLKRGLLRDREALKAAIREYAIPKDDFHLLIHLFSTDRCRAALEKALAKFNDGDVWSLPQVGAGFAAIHSRVFRCIQALAFKRLAFVVSSNNMAFQDMQYELLYKALKTYYVMLPIHKPEAYVVNYVNRAVHNHAINLIKSYTFQKRSRLTGTLDRNGEYQYVLHCMSENQEQAKTTNDDDADELSAVESATTQDEAFSRYEMADSLRRVKQATGIKSAPHRRARTIIRALVQASFDAGFSAYLRRCQHIKKDETNVEFYARVPIAQYKACLAAYLDLAVHKMDLYLKSMYREHFGALT